MEIGELAERLHTMAVVATIDEIHTSLGKQKPHGAKNHKKIAIMGTLSAESAILKRSGRTDCTFAQYLESSPIKYETVLEKIKESLEYGITV